MRVLFLTQFGKLGGSSRIQVLQFMPLFPKFGINATAKSIYPDIFYKSQMDLMEISALGKKINLITYLFSAVLKKLFYSVTAFKYDAVVIQKDTFPKIVYWIMRFVNPRVIYEIDDTIFEINPFLKQGLISSWFLKLQAKLCVNMMKHAACVVAENEYLATEARKHNDKVYILSAPIDIEKYHPLNQQKRQRIITIGWIGSPSTTYLLENLIPVFKRLADLRHDWLLKVVGGRLNFSIPGAPVLCKGWSLEEELDDLQSFDIGIMPLDDSPFNKGRLGYKMVQYMSVGIPTIASDIGLNKAVIINNINGLLAKDSEDWIKKLVLLIDNERLRKEMGKNSRNIAIEKYSLQKQSLIWQRSLNSISNINDK